MWSLTASHQSSPVIKKNARGCIDGNRLCDPGSPGSIINNRSTSLKACQTPKLCTVPWDGILQPWKLITGAIILSLATTRVRLMVEMRYYKVIYLDRVVARSWLTKAARCRMALHCGQPCVFVFFVSFAGAACVGVPAEPTHPLIQMNKGPSERGLHLTVSEVLPGLKLVYLHTDLMSNHTASIQEIEIVPKCIVIFVVMRSCELYPH